MIRFSQKQTEKRSNTEGKQTPLTSHTKSGEKCSVTSFETDFPWDSMRSDGWPKHEAQDRSEQVQKCPFKGSPTVSSVTVFLCVSKPLALGGPRPPAEIHFFALSRAPVLLRDVKLTFWRKSARPQACTSQLPDQNLATKRSGSPTLVVPTFRSRRLQ